MSAPFASTPDEVVRADYPLLSAVTAVASAELLSRSRHSRVYRVVDAAGKAVVVKLAHPQTTARTAALAAALAGTPGVNPLLASGETSGFGYLVYPHQPVTFAELIARGPVPLAEVPGLLGPVAAAIEALHRHGYVHGDLKPDNVLITAAGGGVLADLDEAVAVGTPAERVTPGFAAPELAAGTPVGPAADRYGFACLVAAAISGLPAGRPDSGWLAQQPARLSALLPPAAVAALTADLDPDPARRTVPPRILLDALPVPVPVPVTVTHSAVPVPVPNYALAPDPLRKFEAAVRQAFGEVDSRVPTRDRLPLQVRPERVPVDVTAAPRAVWRNPAFVVATAAAVLAVLAVLVMVVA